MMPMAVAVQASGDYLLDDSTQLRMGKCNGECGSKMPVIINQVRLCNICLFGNDLTSRDLYDTPDTDY